MKTVVEWLQEFNRLYNNIASDAAPGLEPYEISCFLTTAQEAVVVALYKGSLGAPFESTEDVTSYLGTLVKQETVGADKFVEEPYRIVEDSKVVPLPTDILFRTLEFCNVTNSCTSEGKTEVVPVVPVTQDEYFRTVRNPFKKHNSRRVLRLSYSTAEESSSKLSTQPYSELISDLTISSYTVRYLAKPAPIILETLTDGLSINGETEAQTCLLPEVLHQTILSEAVRMAKATWSA